MRISRTVAILTIAAVAIAMLAEQVNTSSARLVWNISPSAPAGLYSIDQTRWDVGDRVAVRLRPPLANDLDRRNILPKGKLLLKRVVAHHGDVACREGESVTVNDRPVATARAASPSGATLPAWYGCQRLGPSDVLLPGDTAASYDGRYFGVTSAHDILGRVDLLITF